MTIPNEPPQISGGENPDHLEHWDIYHAFSPQDTTDANNAVDKYSRMAATWSTDVAEFAARIRRSSAAAWDGAAAEASRQAIDNYAQRALDLAPALQSLAAQVSTAVTGIANTKSNVAEPNDTVGKNIFNPKGWDVGFWHGSRSRAAVDEARDQARAAMRDHYLVDFKSADTQIPVLPQPISPTNPLYTPQQPGNTGGDGGPGGTSTGGGVSPDGTQGPGGTGSNGGDGDHGDQPTTPARTSRRHKTLRPPTLQPPIPLQQLPIRQQPCPQPQTRTPPPRDPAAWAPQACPAVVASAASLAATCLAAVPVASPAVAYPVADPVIPAAACPVPHEPEFR
ncbi:hypothetical protein IU500_13520 [Nocardia terpenica]|uniref:hypothetical protein n=1 Tax=Nocardia terpenica TaxID=455432 RepID=UPI001895C0A3|nr:hypothetical protein [Nocardia terpenica]MBF6062803.1 hypothetical protein [Nocardia terpenica]MBF6105062.1 hypothetical protein [Nocardia terpenica]MBF6112501.1 hypothetical protein [Nocardia terpenica]MBF6118790.1 hypothetical protein [Nocardia terpenica]MBF6154259.1 hypothetical protein [Nocardia terpenica]